MKDERRKERKKKEINGNRKKELKKEKRKSVKLIYTGFILVLFDLSLQHKNFPIFCVM